MPAAGKICGAQAGPASCTEPVLARGLCQRHYRRASRDEPLDPEHGAVIGATPSGHGVWGVLTEEDGRLLCHECGRWYVALGIHVAAAHAGVRAYRLAHGLLMSTSLIASGLRETRSRWGHDLDSIRRVEERRTPYTPLDPEMVARGRRLHDMSQRLPTGKAEPTTR